MKKETFQTRLKWLRKHTYPVRSASFTSQLMGFGDDTLGKYERGEIKRPLAESVAIIADFYNVSMDYLWKGKN